MSTDRTTLLRCSRCKADLPPESFAPTVAARGGGYCRPCNTEYQREWAARQPRKPRPCKSCGAMFVRWDNYQHPGSAIAHCHGCYLAKVRERMNAANERKRGGPVVKRPQPKPGGSRWLEVKRAELLALPDPKCGLCGGAIDPAATHGSDDAAQLDHILPVSAGGSHADHNVQLAHARCNRAAGDKGYRMWRQHPMPRVDVLGLAY